MPTKYQPRPKTPGTCLECGKAFKGRAGRKYCTHNCLLRAFRKRKQTA